MLLNLRNLQNMQTCTEKVSIFGVVKTSNEYLQSLRSVTSLYKNMHLHGNPGSNYELEINVMLLGKLGKL